MAGVILSWDGGELRLDATPSQSHSREVETTEHPVETGSAVTDHIRPKPRELQIEGVSISPFAYDTLSLLMEESTLVTVRTELEIYQSMVLTTLTVPRDASSGDALRFTAKFRKLLFAESLRVTVQIPKSKVDKGLQPTTPASPETQKRGESLIIGLGKGLNNLIAFGSVSGK